MAAQLLTHLMEFGHVVLSDGRGNVTDDFEDTLSSPDTLYAETDSDGQLTGDPIDMAGHGNWELLTGFAADGKFMSEICPSNQCIGGDMEAHIRENAGFYVAVIIDARCECDDECREDHSIGWGVAFTRKCEWYLLCQNEGNMRRPHPVLGSVPICERCNDKAERLSAR